ncbi:MAG: VOC family protein [Actinomycetota bacterium]
MSSIAPSTRMGAVHLAVSDGTAALDFYRDVVGLALLGRDGRAIRLGTGDRELVVVHPGAQGPVGRGTTGLYHLAIVLPGLPEFARFVAHVISIGYPHAPTDHVLTKSDYLWDPDGNGIEIYCETPQDGTWEFVDGTFLSRTVDGRVSSGRDPIDLPALLLDLDPGARLEQGLPPDSHMGHVHLHVHDLSAAIRFYHEFVGFDVTGVAEKWGVGFLSAGGYHHHLGLNIWAGAGARPSPPGVAGLRHFTVELPQEADLSTLAGRLEAAGVPVVPVAHGLSVYDPSHNLIEFTRHRPGDR